MDAITHKIKELDTVQDIVKREKQQHSRIVFTNGCFDLLHKGHINTLMMARSYGDMLIVGLNSDDSVRRLKGNHTLKQQRPINNQADRAYILAALFCVDVVIIFSDDTPYELIATIQPHILVKGGDYRVDEVVGKELVEEVKIVPFVSAKSCSNLIAKIQQTSS